MKKASEMVADLALYQHILLGCKLKIWNCQYSTSRVASELFSIWLNNHLIDTDGVLTGIGEHYVRNYEFMQYELNVAFDNSRLARPLTDQGNYELLRVALGNTFLSGIRPMFLEFIGDYITQSSKILDYAGGNGEYSSTLLNCWKDVTVHMIDKHPQCEDKRVSTKQHDIIVDRSWMLPYCSYYDMIMANEIIHCLSFEDADTALNDIYYMLGKDGKLVVGEQVPTPRMNVRMAAYTNGRMYKQHELIEVVVGSGLFKQEYAISNSHHYFVVFKRV